MRFLRYAGKRLHAHHDLGAGVDGDIADGVRLPSGRFARRAESADRLLGLREPRVDGVRELIDQRLRDRVEVQQRGEAASLELCYP